MGNNLHSHCEHCQRSTPGRKRKTEAEKRHSITLSVAPETVKLLKELRAHRAKVGQIFDRAVAEYYDHLLWQLTNK